MGDVDTLTKLGVEIGLDADAVRQMFSGDTFTADVLGDQQEAYEIGVQGVPFYVFAQKYAVSGAQPVEVFTTALQKAWDDIQATGLCADDSCGI
jgi:predicted DsbA family dithiol-disulfide isomerase